MLLHRDSGERRKKRRRERASYLLVHKRAGGQTTPLPTQLFSSFTFDRLLGAKYGVHAWTLVDCYIYTSLRLFWDVIGGMLSAVTRPFGYRPGRYRHCGQNLPVFEKHCTDQSEPRFRSCHVNYEVESFAEASSW